MLRHMNEPMDDGGHGMHHAAHDPHDHHDPHGAMR
jgi:hypothetical protein